MRFMLLCGYACFMGLVLGCGENPSASTRALPPEQKIPELIILGDSHAAYMPSDGLGVTARNLAKPRATADDTLAVTKRENFAGVRTVLLHVGVNGYAHERPPEQIANTVRKIIETIPRRCLVIVSLPLPVNESNTAAKPVLAFTHVDNARIAELRERMKDATDDQPNAFYINAGEVLADADGNMRAEFLSRDGIHLNKRGYSAWCNFIRDYLK